MQARIIIGIFIANLLVSTAQANIEQIAPPAATNNSIDQEFIHKLGSKTKLSIKLPLPNEVTNIENHFKFHNYDIQLAKTNAYWINFNLSKECQGAPICSAGSLIAIKIKSYSLQKYPLPLALQANQIISMQTPKQILVQINNQQTITNNKNIQTTTAAAITKLSLPSIKNFKTIMLNKNTAAYISAFDSNADNATSFKILAWVKNNTYFQLTLKNMPVAAMIKVANDIKVRLKTSSDTLHNA